MYFNSERMRCSVKFMSIRKSLISILIIMIEAKMRNLNLYLRLSKEHFLSNIKESLSESNQHKLHRKSVERQVCKIFKELQSLFRQNLFEKSSDQLNLQDIHLQLNLKRLNRSVQLQKDQLKHIGKADSKFCEMLMFLKALRNSLLLNSSLKQRLFSKILSKREIRRERISNTTIS